MPYLQIKYEELLQILDESIETIETKSDIDEEKRMFISSCIKDNKKSILALLFVKEKDDAFLNSLWNSRISEDDDQRNTQLVIFNQNIAIQDVILSLIMDYEAWVSLLLSVYTDELDLKLLEKFLIAIVENSRKFDEYDICLKYKLKEQSNLYKEFTEEQLIIWFKNENSKCSKINEIAECKYRNPETLICDISKDKNISVMLNKAFDKGILSYNQNSKGYRIKI